MRSYSGTRFKVHGKVRLINDDSVGRLLKIKGILKVWVKHNSTPMKTND